ncbi:MAG: sigma-54-dependent Fis family transcriptional regulator [Planctomycetes bacterium]|nr:sigma-54-dependent Fis family transcriptional regulator [Planctomycetota bacterium]
METRKLSPQNKEFFALVSRATFTNPFSDQRLEIDRKISRSRPDTSWVEVRPDAIEEVSKRIAKLDAEGTAAINDFPKTDQQLIEHLFLFDVYHQFNEKFDQLIIDQINADEKPLPVPFAHNALAELTKRGFTHQRAIQYFSMFYQIRRAFYFIEKTLTGKCPSMIELRMNLWNNIFTYDILHYEQYLWDRMEDFSILLLGPTGCGKGTAAAAIGRSGFIPFDEKKNTFAESFTEICIPINLSQYSESLIESELFGHTKGAFTGAVASHDGVFSLCGRYGSIFLDEIGEIGTQIQIKLLQVLQERIFTPVGSHKKLSFHGRVIAATNQSIDQLRTEGKFRDDFYYRLCSDCIQVPSLAQRIKENPNELNELIAVTTQRITGKRSKELIRTVTEVIKKRLGTDYHWPGNVRELEQCVRRIMIKRDYLPDILNLEKEYQNQFLADIAHGDLDSQSLLSGYCALLYEKHGTYEAVAQITKLDRRTVKKHIEYYNQK